MNQVHFNARAAIHGIPDREVYHTWYLETGETIDLVVQNDQLFCDVIRDGAVDTQPIDIPENITLKKAIERMKTLQPVLHDDGSVAFATQQTDKWFSALDSDLILDEENWSLTLASTGRSAYNKDDSFLSYLSVAGHAVILIERVDQGQYKLERVHIRKNGNTVLPSHDTDPFQLNIQEQSETWATPKYKVLELLDEVAHENRKLHFDLRGAGSLGVEKNKDVHNCYTWAKEKLAHIGIYLGKEPIFRVQVAALPRIKLAEEALSSKKSVSVHLNLSAKAKQFVLKNGYYVSFAEVVQDIHSYVKDHFQGRSWKVLPQIAPEGFDLSVPVDENEDGSGLQLTERAILPIKIKGIGIQEVDLTKAIQHQLTPFTEWSFFPDQRALHAPSVGCVIS
ncbi:MAG: hypothetical protein K1X28_04395 [Parachlamydiales bacterium]|nr:hypothetical protein [Parachlamydiales bacterium]